MESGLYAACSALMAHSQALNILANNLANVNTAGYKGESQFYQALTAANGGQPLGALNTAVNQFGVLAGQGLNLSSGAIQTTGNPMDVAIDGPGFLVAKTAAGTAYTRAGNLSEGTNGELLTAQGDPVLGELGKGKIGPITLPSGAVSISTDGTISVDGALVAKLHLVEFKPGTQLQPLGNTYFSAPAGSAHTAVQSSLKPGALESSNVNAVQAETDLISLQRHYDLLEQAIKIFNTDFDQPAAQQLPLLK
ncbi:MAG TPA: flagellar basal-body rod protein FlgF [Terriglobales bacterium]|nr:flagellar basal-body rod protein FlgF [Terriglobales bacterium]